MRTKQNLKENLLGEGGRDISNPWFTNFTSSNPLFPDTSSSPILHLPQKRNQNYKYCCGFLEKPQQYAFLLLLNKAYCCGFPKKSQQYALLSWKNINILLRFGVEIAAIYEDIAAVYLLLPPNCCASKTVAIGHLMIAIISIYSTSEIITMDIISQLQLFYPNNENSRN